MDQPTSYDDDVYAWAYAQSALLRGLATSRRDLPNTLDIEHLCEEIEGVARDDLRETESFMRLVLIHLLKIASAPHAPSLEHWKDEVAVFQSDFTTMITPTILRKIDAEKVWRLAVRSARTQLARKGDLILPDLPNVSPFSPAELAGETFDIDVVTDRLRTAVLPQAPT